MLELSDTSYLLIIEAAFRPCREATAAAAPIARITGLINPPNGGAAHCTTVTIRTIFPMQGYAAYTTTTVGCSDWNSDIVPGALGVAHEGLITSKAKNTDHSIDIP